MLLNKQASRRKQAISLTPLIDVVFILLLFFMLTSSFVPWRVLPTNLTTKQDESTEDKVIHVLTLKDNDGAFDYEGQSFKLKANDSLSSLISDKPDAIFALKADANVTLQTLISTADYLKTLGAKSISIANAFNGKPETSLETQQQ